MVNIRRLLYKGLLTKVTEELVIEFAVFGFFMGIEIFFPRKGFTARTVTFVDLEGSHHLTLFLGLVCFDTGQSI